MKKDDFCEDCPERSYYPECDPNFPCPYVNHYDDDYEEETCPEGFTWDEWCDPEERLGIEHCEFHCPFGRIDYVYKKIMVEEE